MSDWIVENRRAVNAGILVMTILLVSLILGLGYEPSTEVPPNLAIGQPSPETFVANRSIDGIPDSDATEEARHIAELNVEAPYTIDPRTTQNVTQRINRFYDDLEDGALLEPVAPDPVLVPGLVGLAASDAESTSSDAGLSFVVVDYVEPSEEGLDGTVASQNPIEGVAVDEGSTVAAVVYMLGASTTSSTSTSTTTTVPDTTTTTLAREERDRQIDTLLVGHPRMNRDEIALFVDLFDQDLDRIAAGEASVFPEMRSASVQWALDELKAGIKDEETDQVISTYLNPLARPPVTIAGLSDTELEDTGNAMGSVVARNIESNESVDDAAWTREKQAARAAIPEQTVSYSLGDTIVEYGDRLTSVQVAAITELGLYQPQTTAGVPLGALILFGIISILIVAFLLERTAPRDFERPRRVALMGIILVLAAAASKIPEIVSSSDHAVGYIIPAVAIGVMASILFDQRVALLLAIPVAGFTAISTGDIAFTVYAGIAAAIPVAFVSSVSTRSQLRLSVLGSAAVAAPVAAALEYLFSTSHTFGGAVQAGSWAFVGAVIGGFIGQGLVSFLESAFGVTTSMSLLDLLDRNHPALQLLEERAPGTFNHSMLVGSIAGKAARAIGADPLLAQAAAWYHDLGKTEHPQYFVENQLGHNPHDHLPPEESAEIIRSHVLDGLSLANQYRIPEDVANGIRMHHGTSLMRYFYHKALTIDPDVDPEIYRHHGVKPVRREMAIVMIADATEAAARAYAQAEQPTEEGLAKLVDTIVTEKLDDGQFDESNLTFGELTMIKGTVVDALSAYYHARVEYPDFPEAAPAEES